ncbi:alpha-(1-2)-phosphatidylinositol mannosyltransferase [Rhodococcus sp. 06-235-1A]|uniref:glycosyltransferase n=1 Tax=Rhodococcus sp. 06-235-1A TaxID=2022508 RepID=UPI000B9BC290|nr:glycosyltransferase [Rhodococcus sp. 06-235-1A]OZD08104.1 alpha-(1-2)-phosphatidylinositol mannosyltransferase [Rhodococcus sp. 06-235-1A]
MRIVQVANFYGPRSGGLRTAVDQLGSGYVTGGHEVTLIVPGAQWREELLPSGVVRIEVPAPRIPGTGGYRVADPRRVSAVASGLRPDVIEVSDRLTLRGMGRWAARRDVRSVMISHERLDRLLAQTMPMRCARHCADLANRRTAEQYDAVVCTTEFAQQEFDRIGVPNVHRVPLGVDLDLFHPRRRVGDRSAWLGGADRLLVHCGRLSVEKHVERSIDSLAALRDSGIQARLIIAGDGPRRAGLERRARGLPVDFLGFVAGRSTVAALLASADIALAPGPHETFGLAALESLAAGTPVVVSETSALAQIVTPHCGGSSENTADGFAAEIERVFELPVDGRRIAARLRAEEFGWPASVSGMLSVLGGRAA